VAADDLDAPLGKTPKRPRLKLPIALPQAIAGVLGLTTAIAIGWMLIARDPYGGQPVAVVATPGSAVKTAEAKAATGAPANAAVDAAKSAIAAKAPPGSKIITITDGSNGAVQQVVVPPNGAAKTGATQQSPTDHPGAADSQLTESSRHGSLPKIAADGRPPAQAYAQPVTIPAGKINEPRIALIVGGLGVSASTTDKAIDTLPGPVTLAFTPYSADLVTVAANARARGHELLLQAPMEPFDYPDNDPGPQTLLTTLSGRENVDRLRWLMSRMQGYVGVASLMGARFTASDAALTPVMQELAHRGLIYVDDGSSPRSVAAQAAGAQNLPFARADVSLDAVSAPNDVDHALARLELKARQTGRATGFINATPAAVSKIADWAKTAAGRGFVLVPVSMVVSKPKSS
jgi:polysaccharide deacetylase 2 family uncharacterized protein YibQ